MTPAENLQLLHRVLTVACACDGEDELFLRPRPGGVVEANVMCNDVFAYACSDCEEITPDNIAAFEQAAADVFAITPARPAKGVEYNANLFSNIGIVFASRLRKQRPFKYGGKYPVDVRIYPLIDAIPGPDTDPDKVWKDLQSLGGAP